MSGEALWGRLPALPGLLLALLAAGPATGRGLPTATDPGLGFVRGMIISCPTYGVIWGSPAMAESLDEVRRLGVRWVAIHPYAGVRRDGSIRFQPARETGFLERAAELVRGERLELFLKPHLAYWGSFGWRGEIDFGADETAWRRFFDGYGEFIVDQARFAEAVGARILAVGVEYERTVGREAEWRRLIARVRQVFSGRLTYAANWDGVDRVPFWDALDLIGVHAYFPLAEDDDPSWEALWRGWDAHLSRLRELSERHGGKPVLFAEIGYSRSPEAARRPWDNHTRDSDRTRALRRRLIEVALARIEAEPSVRGMFWWKWIPGPNGFDDRDFSMKDPEAQAALARYWGERSGGDIRRGPSR